MRHWLCKLCTLQFDKKVVFDLHQKLVHGIDSIKLIRVKEKKEKLCTEDSITTDKSTTFEKENKNTDITEVQESKAVGSSTIVSESCQTTYTNLDIANFVSSISFEDEKNLDIKVEHKHDPGITSIDHEDIGDTHSNRKTPSAASMETFCQRSNVATNLPRIEVIEKLPSFTKESEVITLNRNLTDLQNILRLNLRLNLKLELKFKEAVNSSQSSEIDTSIEKLTKETEAIHSRPKKDLWSIACKGQIIL